MTVFEELVGTGLRSRAEQDRSIQGTVMRIRNVDDSKRTGCTGIYRYQQFAVALEAQLAGLITLHRDEI